MPTIVHFEIPSDDIERSKRFYDRFFGWKIEISFSRAFHAEYVTLLKAIPGGYTNIKAVAVTSDSVTKPRAAV